MINTLDEHHNHSFSLSDVKIQRRENITKRTLFSVKSVNFKALFACRNEKKNIKPYSKKYVKICNDVFYKSDLRGEIILRRISETFCLMNIYLNHSSVAY